MFIATMSGRVVQEPKQFGKILKFRFVHNPGQKSGYNSRFVDVIVGADKWPAQDVLKLQKGDNVTAVGEVELEPWKNDATKVTEVMKFPRIDVPWEVRSRGAAEAATSSGGKAGGKPPAATGPALDELDFGEEGHDEAGVPF